MSDEQSMQLVVRMLTVLEQFHEPNAAIWQQLSGWLKDLISLLESECNGDTEESSSEEEEEIDR